VRGAEAVIRKGSLIGRQVVIKDRIRKTYRAEEIDSRLRRERTRAEAKLLHRAKMAGVDCPTVLEVSEFSLTMDYLRGDHPLMGAKESERAGEILARLHSAGIIHGDFTPVNLIASGGSLSVIDFGLGFFSNDIEDKAVDVFTMLKALDKKSGESFLNGYGAGNPKYGSVLKRLREVEKRVRYS
jgi:TP53 regulating kinase-like protein